MGPICHTGDKEQPMMDRVHGSTIPGVIDSAPTILAGPTRHVSTTAMGAAAHCTRRNLSELERAGAVARRRPNEDIGDSTRCGALESTTLLDGLSPERRYELAGATVAAHERGKTLRLHKTLNQAHQSDKQATVNSLELVLTQGNDRNLAGGEVRGCGKRGNKENPRIWELNSAPSRAQARGKQGEAHHPSGSLS